MTGTNVFPPIMEKNNETIIHHSLIINNYIFQKNAAHIVTWPIKRKPPSIFILSALKASNVLFRANKKWQAAHQPHCKEKICRGFPRYTTAKWKIAAPGGGAPGKITESGDHFRSRGWPTANPRIDSQGPRLHAEKGKKSGENKGAANNARIDGSGTDRSQLSPSSAKCQSAPIGRAATRRGGVISRTDCERRGQTSLGLIDQQHPRPWNPTVELFGSGDSWYPHWLLLRAKLCESWVTTNLWAWWLAFARHWDWDTCFGVIGDFDQGSGYWKVSCTSLWETTFGRLVLGFLSMRLWR